MSYQSVFTTPLPSSRPVLSINRSFIQVLIAADVPCCALGVVEEQAAPIVCVALCLDQPIPAAVLDQGFSFGHCVLGTASFEVIHFSFTFYGFQTYNVLFNLNNAIVQTVLPMMLEFGDYFFFAIESKSGSTTAFRTSMGQHPLMHLKAMLPRVQQSSTTDQQYQRALSQFAAALSPDGILLNWVCHDQVDYLDLSHDCMEMTPT